MAKKPVKAVVKLQIPAGKATPAPPVGTALGPHGLNIQDFCSKFNEATRDKMGNTIPCLLTVYEDRTFDFVLKTPPASEMILKAIKVEKGAKNPKTEKVGQITKAQLREIAQVKLNDLNTNDVEMAVNTLAGTARQMGVEVID
ncbi:MAG TPA: 50S ribosomal protein L11 [bacterium]|nr:50S ribosomal protein L11 [bacterium]